MHKNNPSLLRGMRDYLGINQEKMAMFLNLSIDMIKSIESNRRNIPLDVSTALMALYTCIQQTRDEAPVAEAVNVDERQAALQALYQEHSQIVTRLQTALDKMVLKHAQSLHSQAVYRRFLEIADDAVNNTQRRWAARRLDDAIQQQQRNSQTKQAILEIQLEALDAYLKVIMPFIGK